MTDSAYVGTDFDLRELVDAQTLEETRNALEELLTSTRLGGKAGRLMAARSRFRGRTRDGELTAYVDFLIEDSGIRLGVCDWGYCVYRAETAACMGDERGPNPLWRTESTCVSCANFAVTDRHRPVWQARLERNLALIGDSASMRRAAPLPGRASPSASAFFPVCPHQGKRMTKQHDKRMQATTGKLRAALDHLFHEDGQHPVVPTSRLTIAALACEAGVGRNAIYTNHRDILDDLVKARQRHSQPERTRRVQDRISEQRSMMDEMQVQIRQLVTENAGLMRRAVEAERRADRAERRCALLTEEVDNLRRPRLLRPSDE